jgi:hypothetical protein
MLSSFIIPLPQRPYLALDVGVACLSHTASLRIPVDCSIVADEDEFLPVEVIRRALHLEDSTEIPTNSALAA